jgi:hypothetical protein
MTLTLAVIATLSLRGALFATTQSERQRSHNSDKSNIIDLTSISPFLTGLHSPEYAYSLNPLKGKVHAR